MRADHLGHVNIANTMIYARITDRGRQEMFEELEWNPPIVKAIGWRSRAIESNG